jgi:hypothetical protein
MIHTHVLSRGREESGARWTIKAADAGAVYYLAMETSVSRGRPEF